MGKRLIELRGDRTQQFVADQLRISRARYSHYENNYARPDTDLLERMSEYYGVSVDYLLGRTEERLHFREQKFLRELVTVPIDEVIRKYPLSFCGEKLDLSVDDKRAILTFIKVLVKMKSEEV